MDLDLQAMSVLCLILEGRQEFVEGQEMSEAGTQGFIGNDPHLRNLENPGSTKADYELCRRILREFISPEPCPTGKNSSRRWWASASNDRSIVEGQTDIAELFLHPDWEARRTL